MAVVMMLSVLLASGAFAAQKTVSGTCGGYGCQGYVSCTASGGSARTSFDGPTTVLEVDLWYGDITIIGGVGVIHHSYKSNAGSSVSVSQSVGSGCYSFSSASRWRVHYAEGWDKEYIVFY